MGASLLILRQWPQGWEETQIPQKPGWTGTICCGGGTSPSSTGFILASYPAVLVFHFHQGHPPRRDQVYPAEPLPRIDCQTPARDRVSMSAKTRGSVRRKRRRWKKKRKKLGKEEGNFLTHPHHRHQSTNRLNWVQNTRDGVLGQDGAADLTRGTRAQTRAKQRASSRGWQAAAEQREI